MKFKALRTPEDRKVDLAQTVLQDGASSWWRTFSEEEQAAMSWTSLCQRIRDHFYPKTLKTARSTAFFTTGPSNKPIADIITIFKASFVPVFC